MTKCFTPIDSINDKKRISIRIPKEMYKSVLAIFAKKGFSSRNLSSWVSTSIVRLNKQTDFSSIIAEEWLDKGQNISRPITLTAEAEIALEKMNAMYRCLFQVSAEINSKIVRTAITQKLIEEEMSCEKEE